MPRPQDQDPWSSFRFRVEIEGIPFTGFCRVDGIESIVDIDDVGDRHKHGKRSRRQRVSNIILQRAAGAQRHLWEWHRAAIKGRDDRRDGIIGVLDDSGEVVLRIRFKRAWPCRWRLTTLDALRSGVLIEEVELSVEKLDVK